MSSGPQRQFCRFVRAVIWYHEYIQQFLGIILSVKSCNDVLYTCCLVSCRNQSRELKISPAVFSLSEDMSPKTATSAK